MKKPSNLLLAALVAALLAGAALMNFVGTRGRQDSAPIAVAHDHDGDGKSDHADGAGH